MASDFELPSSTAHTGPKRAQRPAGVSVNTKGNVGTPASLTTSLIPGQEEPEQENVELNEDGSKKEEPKYSKEELLRVFDEIIFSGEYVETYLIRGRLPVSFRTRTAEDINYIQKTIDSAGLNLISSVETMRSILNLQFSLASYDKKDLTGLKPEDRMKMIERLPGPIVGVLIDFMAKFDEKVAMACKEGEENF